MPRYVTGWGSNIFLPLPNSRRAEGDAKLLKRGPGGDIANGDAGRDTVVLGEGNDTVRLQDGGKDRVSCGPGGNDDVLVDEGLDVVLGGCEGVHEK